MTVFDSTLTSEVGLRMPGLQLRSYALHRPSADRSVLHPHAKVWSRAVFFLEGVPRPIEAEPWQPTAGTIVLLPPGPHERTQIETDSLPLCLVLDFRLDDSARRRRTVCTVRREELLHGREQLTYLLKLPGKVPGDQAWEGAVVVLNILLMILRAAGWLQRETVATPPPRDSAMHRLLLTMPLESPLGQVVQRSGYQRDHLNRLIKRETGLTLGQFRAQRRLDRAKELLTRGVKVGNVAGEIGLPDQSYFARWFRRQTGFSPSHWIQTSGAKPLPNLALCG